VSDVANACSGGANMNPKPARTDNVLINPRARILLFIDFNTHCLNWLRLGCLKRMCSIRYLSDAQ
jgi:hypothetical protein